MGIEMNQDQKADFEAWYMREFEVYPRRSESGGFKSQYVNAMFKSWKAGYQAALQSQEVQALKTALFECLLVLEANGPRFGNLAQTKARAALAAMGKQK